MLGVYAYPSYSAVTFEEEAHYGRTVFCRYFDEHRIELNLPVESLVFPEYVVHCCKHSEAVYMSITYRRYEKVNFQVPIMDRTGMSMLSAIRGIEEYKLSLCLSPIFGSETKWLLLVEMFEHYKLQGVEHFYLYIQSIDDYSRKMSFFL
ncbi:unnamed protein product [Strongylus vulgaris]|uniref:Glycosyltransferase family 92 protein n=1 Tax=Strongylus vulgaris TaxID=40348 RepID=A0A3P7KWN6_STRVU|nr:unnamed protein product [Strongylus vulgaris]